MAGNKTGPMPMGCKNKLTRERLMAEFDYDPSTGLFIRHTKHHKSARLGKVGRVDANGYVIISCFGHAYKAHRLAWLFVHGVWPDIVDHINRRRSDNRLCNLRSVTMAENCLNKGLNCNNSSGYNNVYFYSRYGKWRARSRFNGKEHGLGYFDTVEEALIALRECELREFGQVLSNKEWFANHQKGEEQNDSSSTRL